MHLHEYNHWAHLARVSHWRGGWAKHRCRFTVVVVFLTSCSSEPAPSRWTNLKQQWQVCTLQMVTSTADRHRRVRVGVDSHLQILAYLPCRLLFAVFVFTVILETFFWVEGLVQNLPKLAVCGVQTRLVLSLAIGESEYCVLCTTSLFCMYVVCSAYQDRQEISLLEHSV